MTSKRECGDYKHCRNYRERVYMNAIEEENSELDRLEIAWDLELACTAILYLEIQSRSKAEKDRLRAIRLSMLHVFNNVAMEEMIRRGD